MARLTYNSFLSHLKRILIPIGKEGKNTKIRQLHPSQIGFICPFETPEGHCLVGNTLILSEDGSNMFPICQLKDNPTWKVRTICTENGKQHKSNIKDYFEVMPTQLFEFKTVDGHTIQASGMHPFLTWSGRPEDTKTLQWKQSREILPTDWLIRVPTIRQYNETVDSQTAIRARVRGVLRVLYDNEYNRYSFPEYLKWKLFKRDLNSYVETYGIRDGYLYLPSFETMKDYTSIIPEDVKKDRSLLRMFLSGMCSAYGMESILDGKPFLCSTYLYTEQMDEMTKIQEYREIQALCYEMFQIRFLFVNFQVENECYFQLDNSPSQIALCIDHFGVSYNPPVFRKLYVKMTQQTNEDCPRMFFKDDWIAYPIQTIRTCEVELTMDFTTHHDDHTFVANGFITHNSAGIVKNMTLMTQITLPTSNVFLRMILEEMSDIIQTFEHELIYPMRYDYYKIILDGNWIGICQSVEVYDRLLEYKMNKRFPSSVSVSVNRLEKEILIFTDEGRMIRPLFNVNHFPSMNDLKTKSVHELIQHHHIVLKDSYEIENEIIAMNRKECSPSSYYTMCEIHPSLLVGLCVGLIPYSDHTQAPRLTYHASMGKQAIGLYATTNSIRADTMAHLLQYPERPLIQTHVAKYTGCDQMVFGCNLIVAIAMYTGFNQEDSVILNQSAIDRGLLRSFAYRTLHIEERKKSTTYTEDILLPDESIRIKSYNYHKLGADGIVQVGLFVGANDVVVGRVQTKNQKLGKEEKMDMSVVVKSGEEGYVDRIFISTSPEGYKIVKVKIRSLKLPEMGDKVASRSAQKGIVGMVLRQEDMPFCGTTGLIPDLIINPLCLPSRMTINQIIECIAAKSTAYDSKMRYCTPFSSHSTDVMEELCDALRHNGFNPNGKEMMYNGYTGDSFQAQIFIGPTYYHRLKHLVSYKIHARNHGSLQALTRQPVEGRSRDGGLRFGEMERDCMISHGVSRFLTERLFDVSDVFSVPVCSRCGHMPHNIQICNQCESTTIKRIYIPYACKLLFQELMAMGIKINMFPEIQN